MREYIILKKNVANFIIFITTSYFCCCELNQILKRPNSGVFEGMGGVGSFLVEIIPLFNLSHGRKCPFGSLAPPALTLLRRPCRALPMIQENIADNVDVKQEISRRSLIFKELDVENILM